MLRTSASLLSSLAKDENESPQLLQYQNFSKGRQVHLSTGSSMPPLPPVRKHAPPSGLRSSKSFLGSHLTFQEGWGHICAAFHPAVPLETFPIAKLHCAVRTAHCLGTAICIRTSFDLFRIVFFRQEILKPFVLYSVWPRFGPFPAQQCKTNGFVMRMWPRTSRNPQEPDETPAPPPLPSPPPLPTPESQITVTSAVAGRSEGFPSVFSVFFKIKTFHFSTFFVFQHLFNFFVFHFFSFSIFSIFHFFHFSFSSIF